MKILLSQPSTLYYSWQTEILLNNLLSINFCLNDVEIVCSGSRTNEWNKLASRYAAKFFFYPNDSTSNYPSISRPNALKKHFKQFPELSNEVILYIDCDILFLKPLDWINKYLEDDICYTSDTKWYIGYSYFKSKEKQSEKLNIDDELKQLCSLVNLDFDLIKQNDDHSGGAQYLLKHIDHHFWEEVEKDCHTIYNYFSYYTESSINKRYFTSENAGIQSFCADMWAVLWNLWKQNKKTRIVNDFNFAWPGFGYDDKINFNFFHNAGVVNDLEGLFYKGKFINKLPFDDCQCGLKKDKLSYLYVEKILALTDKTCLK